MLYCALNSQLLVKNRNQSYLPRHCSNSTVGVYTPNLHVASVSSLPPSHSGHRVQCEVPSFYESQSRADALPLPRGSPCAVSAGRAASLLLNGKPRRPEGLRSVLLMGGSYPATNTSLPGSYGHLLSIETQSTRKSTFLRLNILRKSHQNLLPFDFQDRFWVRLHVTSKIMSAYTQKAFHTHLCAAEGTYTSSNTKCEIGR